MYLCIMEMLFFKNTVLMYILKNTQGISVCIQTNISIPTNGFSKDKEIKTDKIFSS